MIKGRRVRSSRLNGIVESLIKRLMNRFCVRQIGRSVSRAHQTRRILGKRSINYVYIYHRSTRLIIVKKYVKYVKRFWVFIGTHPNDKLRWSIFPKKVHSDKTTWSFFRIPVSDDPSVLSMLPYTIDNRI